MAKKTAALLPIADELLRQFAGRLRLARLRRRLSAKQVAQRAGMAPMTLRSLERGGSGVTMGAYLAVMQVLGIEKDLDLLGKADPLGRELQDARLPAQAKSTRPVQMPPDKRPAIARSSKPVANAGEVAPERRLAVKKSPQQPLVKPAQAVQNWIEKSGFASADALAGLIVPSPPKKRKTR